ncbi:MAG: apolipoprotein N-acyltransferase [Acidimicrobiia bacterium]|nr:apolipoprotein N-acyltransferase [Acidimicrobiia bacterium]
MTTGLLLFASMPPIDLGWTAFVALVPLLWAWRGTRPRRAAGYAFLAGCVYFSLLLSWVFFFGPFAVVPFVAALAGYWALIGMGVAWLERLGVRSPWVTAALWVTAEAAMGRLPLGGFSWGEVGYAFHGVGTVRILASWGGVLAISFVVVAVNALLLDVWWALERRRSGAGAGGGDRRGLLGAAGGLVAILVVTTGLYVARFEPEPTGELSYALVQANDINRDLTDAEFNARYLPRRHLAEAEAFEGDVDLIVIPESGLDWDPRRDPGYPGDDLGSPGNELGAIEDELGALARSHDAAVLSNASVNVSGDKLENTNFLYDPDGTLQGTYVKRHLVPFGEYVPGRAYLDWIGPLEQVSRDNVSGDEVGLFEVAGHQVGNVICFESAFGSTYRDTVEAGAEIVVVQTNNRSYRRSANTEQHIALSQMRAVETGRPVLHASVSGVTAVISADGTIEATTPIFETVVLAGTATTMTGETPYLRFGDWVVWLSILVVLVAFGFGLFTHRKRP